MLLGNHLLLLEKSTKILQYFDQFYSYKTEHNCTKIILDDLNRDSTAPKQSYFCPPEGDIFLIPKVYLIFITKENSLYKINSKLVVLYTLEVHTYCNQPTFAFQYSRNLLKVNRLLWNILITILIKFSYDIILQNNFENRWSLEILKRSFRKKKLK